MKSSWQKIANKIDALASRERVAVFGALIAVIFFAASALFLDPMHARKKTMETGIAQQSTEMQAIQMQIAAIETKRADPDAANRARRDVLKEQLAEVDQSLKDMNQKLVPAHHMKALLQDMLGRQSRLQLLALRTLPATPLVEKPAKAPEKGAAAGVPPPTTAVADGNVFKHGVEITLQGSYADLYDYLARAEKSQWRMYWSRASLNAEDYPRLKLTITIYTLSLDKAWLEV
jgi:MSHA biogenesis protein MshJ